MRTPDEIHAEIERLRRTGRWIDGALFTVAGGGLAFTSANVTLFAVDRGTPWFIAWLLDPLASIAMMAVLVGDGVLSRHGVSSGRWAAAVKLGSGVATLAMNVWSSIAGGDPASVLLHSIAPSLLVGLAHAAPAYGSRSDRSSTDSALTSTGPGPRPDRSMPGRPAIHPPGSAGRRTERVSIGRRPGDRSNNSGSSWTRRSRPAGSTRCRALKRSEPSWPARRYGPGNYATSDTSTMRGARDE